jgi:hypothetical protein
MTLTTEVRINWPVPAMKLLDHITEIAGGDPDSIARRVTVNGAYNRAGQGLMTLAGIRWMEQPETDVGEVDEPWPVPPALVVLHVDNPYGYGDDEHRGRWVQANRVLPAVVEWLDQQGVPRTSWWWEDETAGTYHPGTEPVSKLDSGDERETWQPAEVASR